MEHKISRWEKLGLAFTYAIGLSILSVVGYNSYQQMQTQQARRVAGFIVAKEWTKRHMSNKPAPQVQEASLFSVVVPIPTVYVPSTHTPVLVPSSFRVWVANKESLRIVEVDSAHWFTLRCGQRCTYVYRD